ncbi:tetratricopeptide repeat protein [Spirochaeta cellobiosiphila]|uniref:tetratricopeptide repeat protein n=1 Tax=Spirochaeta cellobiosiphila TaxID=504483 RepID=UPI0004242EFE|nr:tetratricopeptide repeat protein [Spirochaeta cellobiosiphila]
MSYDNPLGNIYFVSIPESWSTKYPELPIESDTLLPVEISGDIKNWNMTDMSWEMILSGMLKVLAYHRHHKSIKAYRDLVFYLKPDIETELTSVALLKAEQKEYSLAEEIFLSLQGLYPKKSVYLLNLALLYENMSIHYASIGQKDVSLEHEEKARALFDSTVDETMPWEFYYHGGLFYLRHNSLIKGIEYLKTYLDKGQDKDKRQIAQNWIGQLATEEDERYQIAYEAMLSEDIDAAIELVGDFLKDNPRSWNGLFLLGWALRAKTHYEEACFVFNKALEVRESADVYNELAICFMELNKISDAGEYLEKAMALAPKDIKILSNKAIWHLKIEENNKAIEYFNKVLEIVPDDPMALDFLKKINN